MNYSWILIVIGYFLFSHLIAQYIGAKREIGYGKSVFFSVLFSPLLGLLITLSSKKLSTEAT